MEKIFIAMCPEWTDEDTFLSIMSEFSPSTHELIICPQTTFLTDYAEEQKYTTYPITVEEKDGNYKHALKFDRMLKLHTPNTVVIFSACNSKIMDYVRNLCLKYRDSYGYPLYIKYVKDGIDSAGESFVEISDL